MHDDTLDLFTAKAVEEALEEWFQWENKEEENLKEKAEALGVSLAYYIAEFT